MSVAAASPLPGRVQSQDVMIRAGRWSVGASRRALTRRATAASVDEQDQYRASLLVVSSAGWIGTRPPVAGGDEAAGVLDLLHRPRDDRSDRQDSVAAEYAGREYVPERSGRRIMGCVGP